MSSALQRTRNTTPQATIHRNSESPSRACRFHGSAIATRSRTTSSRNTNRARQLTQSRAVEITTASTSTTAATKSQNGSARMERNPSTHSRGSLPLPWTVNRIPFDDHCQNSCAS